VMMMVMINHHHQSIMQSKKETIFIIGSSGNVGKSTLEYLKNMKLNSHFTVKGGIRDQSKLPELSEKYPDFQFVTMDLDIPSSVVTALRGVDRVFFIPGNVNQRFQHGKAAIDAAVDNKVKYFLLMSMIGADPKSPALFGRQFGSTEEYLVNSGLNFTSLRTIFFQQNLMFFLDGIRNTGIFGWPLGQGKVPLLNVQDIGRAAARLLAQDPNSLTLSYGRTYTLTGPEALSGDGIAAILSRVLNRNVRYQPEDPLRIRDFFLQNGMEQWQADGIVELFEMFAANKVAFVSEDNRMLLGEERPTSVYDWLATVVGPPPTKEGTKPVDQPSTHPILGIGPDRR